MGPKHGLGSDIPFLFARARPQWESSKCTDRCLATREYKTLRRREIIFQYIQDLLSKVNYKQGQRILKANAFQDILPCQRFRINNHFKYPLIIRLDRRKILVSISSVFSSLTFIALASSR